MEIQVKPILYYFLAFLTSLFIFIGLPLLGWGILDLPRFFDHPARSAYVLVIFILQLLAVLYNLVHNDRSPISGYAP